MGGWEGEVVGHRRSIRIPTYDYATPGVYYVTIVVQHRACILGSVVDGTVQLSHFGQAVDCWWGNISVHFPTAQHDAYVIMPNHLHGLLRLGYETHEDRGELIPAITDSVNLGRVLQWFKSKTTYDYQIGMQFYGWPPYPRRLWQRNYYEHIVRSDADLDRIRAYILVNPTQWENDAEMRHASGGFDGSS